MCGSWKVCVQKTCLLQSGFDSILIVDCSTLHSVTALAKSEALGWINSMNTIMTSIYPGLFKTVYVLNGMQTQLALSNSRIKA